MGQDEVYGDHAETIAVSENYSLCNK